MFIHDGPRPELGHPAAEWRFASTTEEKTRVLEALLAFLNTRGLVTDDDQFWCRLVLDEALVNAVKHGNGYDPRKTVTAACHVADDRWQVLIADEGRGFKPDAVPSLDDDDSLLMNHGRGVNLMLHYMDDVDYFEGGRVLVLVKKRRTA
jgi:serine/threonine-protein kinase RsbW